MLRAASFCRSWNSEIEQHCRRAISRHGRTALFDISASADPVFLDESPEIAHERPGR